jgi:hypothetical protein
MNQERLTAESYLGKVYEKLLHSGYKVSQNLSYKNQTFLLAARKTQFDTSRYGFFNVTYIFSKFSFPDFAQLKQVSSLSYQCAKKISGLHFPPGFLYGLLCIPVVITDSLAMETIKDIQQKSLPVHWGASLKIGVFDLDTQKLYYCETSPTLGSMYHDFDRMIIQSALDFSKA